MRIYLILIIIGLGLFVALGGLTAFNYNPTATHCTGVGNNMFSCSWQDGASVDISNGYEISYSFSSSGGYPQTTAFSTLLTSLQDTNPQLLPEIAENNFCQYKSASGILTYGNRNGCETSCYFISKTGRNITLGDNTFSPALFTSRCPVSYRVVYADLTPHFTSELLIIETKVTDRVTLQVLGTSQGYGLCNLQTQKCKIVDINPPKETSSNNVEYDITSMKIYLTPDKEVTNEEICKYTGKECPAPVIVQPTNPVGNTEGDVVNGDTPEPNKKIWLVWLWEKIKEFFQ